MYNIYKLNKKYQEQIKKGKQNEFAPIEIKIYYHYSSGEFLLSANANSYSFFS